MSNEMKTKGPENKILKFKYHYGSTTLAEIPKFYNSDPFKRVAISKVPVPKHTDSVALSKPTKRHWSTRYKQAAKDLFRMTIETDRPKRKNLPITDATQPKPNQGHDQEITRKLQTPTIKTSRSTPKSFNWVSKGEDPRCIKHTPFALEARENNGF